MKHIVPITTHTVPALANEKGVDATMFGKFACSLGYLTGTDGSIVAQCKANQ